MRALLLAFALVVGACGDQDPAETSTTNATLSTTTVSVADDVPSTTTHTDDSGALMNRTFVSRSIAISGGASSLFDNTRVTVAFQQRATGAVMQWRADCNHMGGSVLFEGGRITVTEAGGTTAGCDPHRLEQDNWISRFIVDGPAWSLDNDVLILETTSATIEFAVT
jgi:heat shock protein HslJ